MPQIKKHPTLVILLATVFLCLCAPADTHAEGGLPEFVQKQLHTPLMEVGQGTYRKFGFSIYHATLWATAGVWDSRKPYALELRYTRGVSKETMVDTVADDIRDQHVADEETRARWTKVLEEVLPAVEEGDVIIGLAIPGKESLLFYNGAKLTSIRDQAFSQAFFNVWLGPQADEELREKLLGHTDSQ